MTDSNHDGQNSITGLLTYLSVENGLVRLDIVPDGKTDRWAERWGAIAVAGTVTISSQEDN